MNEENTQEILQDNNSPVSVDNDSWTTLLNDMHRCVQETNEILTSQLQMIDTNSQMTYYENMSSLFSMSIILNAILIGCVLALIFSNFFSGGNHK